MAHKHPPALLAFLFSLTAALFLAGCSPAAGSPRLVAAAPHTPAAVYPPQTVPVYDFHLELEVPDVPAAAAEAVRLAEAYGGYPITRDGWNENDRPAASLVLAVPNAQVARLHTGLLQLGRPISEDFSTFPANCRDCQPYAKVTLVLCSRPAFLVDSDAGRGWNPIHTFQSAFNVFASIWGFVADAFIWAIVVVGPFILAGFGACWLVKVLRRRSRLP